ncbi:tRNA (adenosine(37)-N6)-threonylcarbamoyltransferase complex dimerization subunit type 1 TsaB [Thorsellia anophelis]|uniref:tRNA threonylcarbamoyladenosine biosynthesis protein TsaB n=1 Tax=Thorsellia anophelis DSM 18579 TaxID=1123402 RepID=A0A1I0F0V7_9GAMM|nr:tRNA (adenosine(37)-N6)-threonylcarbamoyltransferase complex dimerization subunit type 1 TsaB [Thorsellia anophelis]SET51586.1 tRNA threonylcarbamoyladenosine biosynthesis protein TsaB [Thorsellia anophelis DSM 18579]
MNETNQISINQMVNSFDNITLLAVDTATESCSAALWHNGKLSALNTEAPRAHTEKILPMVDKLLSDAAINLNQVDAIAFGQGPGSFTGIRVGVSVAQGLGFGSNKPLIPISNLMALAEGARRVYGHNHVICAIDARMGEIYAAALRYCLEQNCWQYLVDESVKAPQIWLNEFQTHLDATFIVNKGINFIPAGTGFETYELLFELNSKYNIISKPDLTAPLFRLPLAADMIPIALNKFTKQEIINAIDAEPTYLRNEVTWQKLPGR